MNAAAVEVLKLHVDIVAGYGQSDEYRYFSTESLSDTTKMCATNTDGD